MAIVSIYLCVFHTHFGFCSRECFSFFFLHDVLVPENVAATIDFSTS